MMSTNFHPVSKRLSGSSFKMMVAGFQLIVMKFVNEQSAPVCACQSHTYMLLRFILYVSRYNTGRTRGYVVHVSDAECRVD